MKICGYSEQALEADQVQPTSLAEITLIASPAELRLIAAFLLKAADKMESMGTSYGHEHLSDRQPGFEDSPHFVVFNSTNLG
jgi:hypothetical protein